MEVEWFVFFWVECVGVLSFCFYYRYTNFVISFEYIVGVFFVEELNVKFGYK